MGSLHCTPNKSLADKEPLNRNPSLLCHQINREERENPFFPLLQLLTLHTGAAPGLTPSQRHPLSIMWITGILTGGSSGLGFNPGSRSLGQSGKAFTPESD